MLVFVYRDKIAKRMFKEHQHTYHIEFYVVLNNRVCYEDMEGIGRDL